MSKEMIIVASVLISLFGIVFIYFNYKRNYYLEPEEKYQERVDRIKSKDGNHMVLLTAIDRDRERRKENKSKLWFFRHSV